MQKAYSRTYWENKPSDRSPINERNLNNIESGVDTIDDRVVTIDITKFDKTEAQGLIKNITFDLQTGILTKYYYNGSAEEINTGISKLNMNLRFDKESQILYIVNADGTEDPVDLSVFITNYEFRDSDTIAHNVSSDGTVTSIVKEGSIEEKHLRPDYLADIKVEVAKAQSSATSAAQSANEADYDAKLAQSYAVGSSGIRDNEENDNAKKYKEQSQANANTAQEYLGKVEKAGNDAVQAVKDALGNVTPEFSYDFETGILYCNSTRFIFTIKRENGILYWGAGV